jgi:hypothetical protein
MSLDNLLIAAETQARDVILKRQRELPPTWVLINAKGETQIEITPWRDELEKQFVRIFIKGMIKRQKTVAYSFLVEAWMATAPKGWEPGVDPPIAASEQPNRQECVVACAVQGKEKHWILWTIKRNASGKAISLDRRPDEPERVEGWMSEMLEGGPP